MLPGPEHGVVAFAEAVARIASEHAYDLILPGSDAASVALSQHKDRFEAGLGLPDAEGVERAMNRQAIAEAAAQAGIPVAEQRLCDGIEAGLEAARELGYPVMVKPLQVVSSEGDVTRRGWSLRAAGDDDLRAAVEMLGSRYVVQAYELGPVVSFGGLMAGGELLGVAVSRYLRTWEPKAGNVAFSETIAPPPGLDDAVGRLVGELGWEGIFELELIERADGSYGPIDFNPRIYGSLALAVRAGANLPVMWARRMLGESPQRAVARPRVRYRWEFADGRHALWQLRRGRLGAALAVLRPRRSVAHAYFRARDPMPFLARLAISIADGRRSAPEFRLPRRST
jgi:predicted ATP-grasp superfamily ATP-dependent carboligase